MKFSTKLQSVPFLQHRDQVFFKWMSWHLIMKMFAFGDAFEFSFNCKQIYLFFNVKKNVQLSWILDV